MSKEIQLNKIATEFAKAFKESWTYDYAESEMILHFVNKVIQEWYFWADEVTTVWNSEDNAFDIFYNATFWQKDFYVSINYIEWLNEQEDEQLIIEELITIIHRAEEDITYLKEYASK